jgi:hypothetical protein
MTKYEKHNYKVTRKRDGKDIDMTFEDYGSIWSALGKVNEERILKKKTSMFEMLVNL